ncbi:hypothetical protein [Desulfosarcina ovata]|uniref:Uncharacterized protein n=1 Tax=Desulfosarcina ovata subsp. ovata TaxID=2752305 RepID=A0A5K8AGK6_9BACT|nr:hypothetical protein [Desulfosarcina ovata]BBO91832.1 hypothetical protein DSCOOX_50120 [Desulfosarcina ovata subsp. ovata]
MKITVDSNLRIRNSFEPPLQLELEGREQGLQDVLQKLTDMHPPLKFIDQGEMGDDLHHLYLNGESHFSFSEGLKKKIKDGDTIRVEAYLEPLDGH